MKIKHPSTVLHCRNIIANEQCKYGDNCWFLHQQTNFDKTIMNNIETKNDVIQKIFEEMEKMTGRISLLEVKN